VPDALIVAGAAALLAGTGANAAHAMILARRAESTLR
jgi:hypothetical protein